MGLAGPCVYPAFAVFGHGPSEGWGFAVGPGPPVRPRRDVEEGQLVFSGLRLGRSTGPLLPRPLARRGPPGPYVTVAPG